VGPVREIVAERMGIDINEPGAMERAEAEGKLQFTPPMSEAVDKSA
jgi:hypothetical protein